jgi:hypothetical protein
MGGTSFSRSDYSARTSLRADISSKTGRSVADATFAYSADIKAGKTKATVHPSLSPHGAKVRESRDSAEHPVTVPIIITLDTTGSMSSVPFTIQGKLPLLMGHFLEDKASGKKYLGDGYPAIMISAVDDYPAQGADGCLQVGQFESGIEIDDNLTNLWITHNGGGTYEESYDLALYFAARHTVHDNLEKRGRRGYMFIIGDEKAYPKVTRRQITEVINADPMQDDIPLEQIVEEAKEKYHVFFVIPASTNHYGDPVLEKFWVNLLGQQNVLKLPDPEKICELICGAVAICEEHVGVDDLTTDGLNSTALTLLAATAGGAVSRHDATGLAAIAGSGGGTERL